MRHFVSTHCNLNTSNGLFFPFYTKERSKCLVGTRTTTKELTSPCTFSFVY